MSKKVNIRFLRQGLVKADTPDGFDKMTAKEKLDWASKHLSGLPDKRIIAAMADFEKPGKDGYFDGAPSASAIEKGEDEDQREIIVETGEWKLFRTGEGQEAIRQVNASEAKEKSFVVRLYLEVRYDFRVDAENAEEAAKKAIKENNLYELVAGQTGEYAENIHAIVVDRYDKNGLAESHDINVDKVCI